MNPKKSTPRHVVIKMVKVKDKERIQKGAREKLVMYKGNPTKLSADFSAETFQAKKEQHDTFKVLRGKISQPRLSFRTEGEIKSFPDKQKLKEFITTKPALPEM